MAWQVLAIQNQSLLKIKFANWLFKENENKETEWLLPRGKK